MYRAGGYLEIARFNDNPYAHHWFEKELADGRQAETAASTRSTKAASGTDPAHA